MARQKRAITRLSSRPRCKLCSAERQLCGRLRRQHRINAIAAQTGPMRTSRQRAATDGFGPVQNLRQDAAFVAKGGKQTFAALCIEVCYADRTDLGFSIFADAALPCICGTTAGATQRVSSIRLFIGVVSAKTEPVLSLRVDRTNRTQDFVRLILSCWSLLSPICLWSFIRESNFGLRPARLNRPPRA